MKIYTNYLPLHSMFCSYLFKGLVIITCFSACVKKELLEVPKEVKPPTVDSTLIEEHRFNNEGLFLSPAEEQLQGEILIKPRSRFIQRSWQGIPSIGRSADGILFAAWYTGASDEGPGNYITLSLSRDNGSTWRSNQVIINPIDPMVRFFDPCFWNDKFGNLYFSWAKSNGPGIYDNTAGVWTTKIKFSSKGDSIVYTTPKRMANGVMMNKPINCRENTMMMFPIAHWYRNNANIQKAFFYTANYADSEKKIINFSQSSFFNIMNHLRWYDEHMLVELKNGTFLSMLRGRDGIYFSKSKDGITWSPAVKFTALGATTSSRFYLGRLKSGNLILVMNSSTERTNMKVFLSKDDGETWSHSMLLDAGKLVSYPDLVEGVNGELFIVYDQDRYGSGKIHMVKFKESDIINNNVSGIKRYLVAQK